MSNKKQDMKRNNEPSHIIPMQPPEGLRYYKRSVEFNTYEFYIFGEIGEPEKYIDLFHILRGADKNDTIFIYINSSGGNLYTAVQLLSAMNSSAARIITSLDGQVYSAATFIYLAGDVKIVNPNCTFMIHNYSQTAGGRGNELKTHISYMVEYFDHLARDVYKNFLKTEEIDDVLNGRDIWLSSHDVAERLKLYDHEFIYAGDDWGVEPTSKKPTKKTTTKRSKVVKK